MSIIKSIGFWDQMNLNLRRLMMSARLKNWISRLLLSLITVFKGQSDYAIQHNYNSYISIVVVCSRPCSSELNGITFSFEGNHQRDGLRRSSYRKQSFVVFDNNFCLLTFLWKGP